MMNEVSNELHRVNVDARWQRNLGSRLGVYFTVVVANDYVSHFV